AARAGGHEHAVNHGWFRSLSGGYLTGGWGEAGPERGGPAAARGRWHVLRLPNGPARWPVPGRIHQMTSTRPAGSRTWGTPAGTLTRSALRLAGVGCSQEKSAA